MSCNELYMVKRTTHCHGAPRCFRKDSLDRYIFHKCFMLLIFVTFVKPSQFKYSMIHAIQYSGFSSLRINLSPFTKFSVKRARGAKEAFVLCQFLRVIMTGDGSVATPVDLSLSAAQRNVVEPEDAEERLVIISIPREARPVQRENIVEALVDFQFFDWEAVGRFGRGLVFQVLLERKADAQTMAEMGHIEIVTERGTFGCSTRLLKEREYKVRVDWLPMSTTLQEVAGLFGD